MKKSAAGAAAEEKKPEPYGSGFFRSFLFSNVHASLLAILAELLKTKHAVYLGKQGVVFADTDVDAGMDVGTTLANENVAGENELTVSALGAKALGLGVTAVLGGAHTFFMSEELKTDVHHNNVSILSVE